MLAKSILNLKKLKTIYKKGLENRLSLDEGRISKYTELKRIIYCLVICLFVPYRNIEDDSIYFVNGKSQRNLKLNVSSTQRIYRGFGENILSSLKNDCFLFSPIKKSKRIILLKDAVRTYKKVDDQDRLSLWIDFLITKEMLIIIHPSIVISRGHTDEYTTWMGEFAKEFRFCFEVYQHGVMGCMDTTHIPNKIHYSKFYAFDQYSAEYFRDNFISNENCEFIIYDFPPSVQFECIEREEGKVYIGIGEQKNSDWVRSIVEYLESLDKEVVIIIMKHPLSSYDYSVLDRVIVDNRIKYGNIDYFITENSTLAIDYYRANMDVKVIYTDFLAKGCFCDYHFTYIENLSDLDAIIK